MKRLTTTTKALLMAALFLAAVAFPTQQSISQTADIEVVKQDKYSPVGVWTYKVSTPDGDLEDEMTISKNDEGAFEVSIESDVYGTLELEDITFEKMVMEASVDLNGDSVAFEFEFDGDSMEGMVYAGEDELSITAERKK
ncbi:hypothetical protein [Roseivirga misakiensis]|uniref:Uncharacterized protein n=1 Tax=Roseivirga misakiensis TaxID=1563681 RepID=A0A1E5SZ81_9BACT|nr:hypothetical protein [Roseivirga misakiensis]OEK04422.1 hypothetical protein BFP71_13165 [Roseivirga misakiensis]